MKTKSINEMMAETSAKVDSAVIAESAYYALMEALSNDYESSRKVLDASDERKKALKVAIKAVKNLFDLFDLHAPRLHYLSDVQGAFCIVNRYWDKMQEFARNVY